jgi:LCP family protein required for cell wall assembly
MTYADVDSRPRRGPGYYDSRYATDSPYGTDYREVDPRYSDHRYGDDRRYRRRGRDDDGYDDDPPNLGTGRRGPRWAKLCLILGSLLMVVSGAAIVGGKAVTAYFTGGLKQEDLLGNQRAEGANIEGAVNILLLGMDERANSQAMIRTDSIIIAHITANHDAVYLISLPRDTRVLVPRFEPSHFAGGYMKLTEAFAVGNATPEGHGDPSLQGRQKGVQLMAQTINGLVPGGLKFNAVALINYSGFKKLVEALGGVDMCIDQRVVSLHYDRSGKYVTDTIKKGIPGYVYEPGCRMLQPWEALDYVRQRENLPHGDYDRQRHQQQFLFAVFKQLLSKGTLTDITKFGQLKDAAGELLTLDLGKTSIPDWIFSFKTVRSNDITMIKTNAGKYSSETIDNKSFEVLSADSVKLMEALRDDKIYDFLVSHPDWVARSNAP